MQCMQKKVNKSQGEFHGCFLRYLLIFLHPFWLIIQDLEKISVCYQLCFVKGEVE
jgi:hypothetical protein